MVTQLGLSLLEIHDKQVLDTKSIDHTKFSGDKSLANHVKMHGHAQGQWSML